MISRHNTSFAYRKTNTYDTVCNTDAIQYRPIKHNEFRIADRAKLFL